MRSWIFVIITALAMFHEVSAPTDPNPAPPAVTIAVGPTTLGEVAELIGYAPWLPDARVYVADKAPADHSLYVGLLCPAFSGGHPYCQEMQTPYITLYSANIRTIAEWTMVLAHEEYHMRLPSMSEARAWDYGCEISWVERWCGEGAFRGGTR